MVLALYVCYIRPSSGEILTCKHGAPFSNQQQEYDAIRTENEKAVPPNSPGLFFESIHFLVKRTFILRGAVSKPTGERLVCETTVWAIASNGHNEAQDLNRHNNEQNEVEGPRFFH
jgi:hypothetical protein